MGITENHVMESLSRAYVQAIAGYARLNLRLELGAQEFDYGVDGTFYSVKTFEGRLVQSGFPLDFQLKATTNWQVNSSHVVYRMNAAAYNKIVDRNSTGTVPQILILLCLPVSPLEWLENTEEQLSLKKCCYWQHLTGDLTDNKSGVTVQIPRTQLLNSDSLLHLIKQVELGGWKC
jgi:hypothetical protein